MTIGTLSGIYYGTGTIGIMMFVTSETSVLNLIGLILWFFMFVLITLNDKENKRGKK